MIGTEKAEHILPDHFDVGGRQSFLQTGHKGFPREFRPVEFPDPRLQMGKMKGNLVRHIPLKVIPVTSFHAGFPVAVYQRVHLAGKKVRQRDTTHHEGKGLEEQFLLRLEAGRRIGVQFKVRQNVDKRTWLQIFRAEIDEVNKYREQRERQRTIDEIRRQAI